MNRCDNCKYFLAEHTGLRLPTCTLYGHPLAKSTAHTPEEKGAFFVRIGDTCPSHEVGAPEHDRQPREARPIIGMPLPEITETVSREAATRTPCSSCTDCKWLVPASKALDFGFDSPICAARAELLPSGQLVQIAGHCEIGNQGANRTSTDGLFLDDRYDLSTVASVNVGGAGPSGPFDPFHHSRVDPRDWPTELPVTAEDLDGGIKAWRLVYDPQGGDRKPIPMPIFDSARLCPGRDVRQTYGDHRPDLYVDHAALLYTAAFLYMGGLHEDSEAINQTLALVGDAGTGKTEFWCYFAWLMDLPFHRISVRPDTDSLEFFGKTELVTNPDTKQSVTEFRAARFAKYVQEPCVICVDEPNSGPDNIWFLMRPCFDSARQLVIEGEDLVIIPDDYCFIGLAMNHAWKPEYRGTRDLSPADADRIAFRAVELPERETEEAIIRLHCNAVGYAIPDSTLDKIMSIAAEIRATSEETMISWGVRPNVAVAKYTRGMGIERAYRLALLDRLDPTTADDILTSVRGHA